MLSSTREMVCTKNVRVGIESTFCESTLVDEIHQFETLHDKLCVYGKALQHGRVYCSLVAQWNTLFQDLRVISTTIQSNKVNIQIQIRYMPQKEPTCFDTADVLKGHIATLPAFTSPFLG